MPKIVINEIDKTTSPRGEYTNFTVVVPGLVVKGKSDLNCFDVNGICELHTQKDLEDKIDFFPTATYKFTPISETEEEIAEEVTLSQYGNQIAYELLGLGYTVLYKAFYIPTESMTADEQKAYADHGINSIEKLGDRNYWECLEDKSEYDFRYIMTGLIDNVDCEFKLDAENTFGNVAKAISDVSEIRQDCVALVDISAKHYEGKSQALVCQERTSCLSELPTSTYSAIFAPYVEYDIVVPAEYIINNTPNTIFPASFHYLACNAKAAENYSEWYAIAGYTRGVSKYSIKRVGCVFGEKAIETFEPRTSDAGVNRSVNLIVKIKNNYYLWGNRTAAKLNSKDDEPSDLTAKHFLNIRQLCTTIKKQVYVACRRFTFDPNSDILWLNFCNAIKPTLEKMRADQGIADYKLIKVKAPKATLKAKIRIVPIEAVEDFEIDLFLEDSLNGTVIAE